MTRVPTIVVIGDLIIYLIQLYSLLIIVRALISWVGAEPRNQLVRMLHTLTDPILEPIQNVIPPLGSIDISPLVALVFLQLLREVVTRVLW